MRARVGVVGAGLAGLTAALRLAVKGFEVTVLHLGGLGGSNSYRIQAGIALPLGEGDSIALHVADTLRVGWFTNDPEAVWSIISKAGEAHEFLTSLGVRFEGVELEGGHSRPRVHTIRGETGRHIMEALWSRAEGEGVELVEDQAVELLIHEGECLGVAAASGRVYEFDATIVAAGGYTGLYKYTSGSGYDTGVLLGDYIRKGGPARDLEFIQFHPTAYIAPDGSVVLLSEALRGRGAKIIDEGGSRFVNELAPRDEVSRAIYRKLRSGSKVYLDARGIEGVERLFPGIYEALLEKGVDMAREPVPITPVAHYSIGGFPVDAYWRTPTRRLYAIGEAAASGLHGANRLPSNSSLECVVSGLESARTVARDLESLGPASRGPPEPLGPPGRVEAHPGLAEVLWSLVGIERSGEGLERAIEAIKGLEGVPGQLRSLALGIALCALERRESRGVHYRVDYPYMDARYSGPSLLEGGACRIPAPGPRLALAGG
ncbi:MAG: FAD-binding protein [Desulfurococcales archaeon]|nr:FAD-binding protein [Desulfurococcales archaeon]